MPSLPYGTLSNERFFVGLGVSRWCIASLVAEFYIGPKGRRSKVPGRYVVVAVAWSILHPEDSNESARQETRGNSGQIDAPRRLWPDLNELADPLEAPDQFEWRLVVVP